MKLHAACPMALVAGGRHHRRLVLLPVMQMFLRRKPLTIWVQVLSRQWSEVLRPRLREPRLQASTTAGAESPQLLVALVALGLVLVLEVLARVAL